MKTLILKIAKQDQMIDFSIMVLICNNTFFQYKLILKLMKTNRSLKEIMLPKTRFQEEKSYTPHITLVSVTSPTSPYHLNFQNIDSHLTSDSKSKQLRNQKNCQSQRQLQPQTVRGQLASPKHFPTDVKTERSKVLQDRLKDAENIETTPFDVYKPSKNVDYRSKVLTPANRNLTQIDQPKRPRILTKARPSLSFSEQFKLGKTLGKGRFGNVYRAQHNIIKMLVAVKKISLQKVCKKLIERLTWQIKIQTYLKHEHCLQLYKCQKEGNNLYLVVELGDCSLFDRLREKKYFTQVETCYYVTQTMKALMHMHEHGIIHRDIKPENIVLINNVVKLADFGWAIYIGKNSKRTTFCGTLDYVSPQIVLGDEYDEMVDVWSVGVLCYELCTGHAPFQSSKSREETYRKIVNVELKFPKYLSDDVKDFITRLLIKNPENRMSLTEAMSHRWVKRYFMK